MPAVIVGQSSWRPTIQKGARASSLKGDRNGASGEAASSLLQALARTGVILWEIDRVMQTRILIVDDNQEIVLALEKGEVAATE